MKEVFIHPRTSVAQEAAVHSAQVRGFTQGVLVTGFLILLEIIGVYVWALV